MNTKQKIGITAAAGIIGVGSLIGIAYAQADPTDSQSPSASSSSSAGLGNQHHRGGQEGRGMMMQGNMAAKLAEKLGLDQTRVADAIEAAQDATRPTDRDAGTRLTEAQREAVHEAFVQELASQLGSDQATVSKALDEIRAEADTQRKADLQTRLDKAVSDGKLTKAEADAVLKAAEAGIIGFGGGRR